MKNIVIIGFDNDFMDALDFIAKSLLLFVNKETLTGNTILTTKDDVLSFIKSMLPTAIEFGCYRVTDEYNSERYRKIEKTELDRLVRSILEDIKLFVDADLQDHNGYEHHIIDFENNTFKTYC